MASRRKVPCSPWLWDSQRIGMTFHVLALNLTSDMPSHPDSSFCHVDDAMFLAGLAEATCTQLRAEFLNLTATMKRFRVYWLGTLLAVVIVGSMAAVVLCWSAYEWLKHTVAAFPAPIPPAPQRRSRTSPAALLDAHRDLTG